MPKAVTTGRKITMAEVERHATRDSAWFVRDGKVRALSMHDPKESCTFQNHAEEAAVLQLHSAAAAPSSPRLMRTHMMQQLHVGARQCVL